MDSDRLLQFINDASQNTLMQTLGIKFLEASQDRVVATMPVTPKVHQPDGVLHGGASVALAETVGSFASVLNIDREKQMVRGLEISANHLRGKSEGIVTATARPLHKGKTTHLWEIRIEDENHKLISLCKLSTIILSKNK
ncbi:MAG: hotdog fold thioesterase [Flavobacteriaceae bacterium]|nr:hotdog fold thioesterase [Flavobacteriaceae bacterium]